MMKFKYYQDAGHGWVAVKRKFLNNIMNTDLISPYSYQRGGTVYLEEDGDLERFVVALNARGMRKGVDYDFIVKHHIDGRSPIRSYSSYRPEIAA